jgi:hypothetical protein
MTNNSPSMGQAISTFSFLLFGFLLSLAALAEEDALKSTLIGVCAILSFTGAARFRLQSAINRYRARPKE